MSAAKLTEDQLVMLDHLAHGTPLNQSAAELVVRVAGEFLELIDPDGKREGKS